MLGNLKLVDPMCLRVSPLWPSMLLSCPVVGRGPIERFAIRADARLEPKRVSCSDWHATMTKMAMEIGKMIIMMMMIKMISMLKQHWSST